MTRHGTGPGPAPFDGGPLTRPARGRSVPVHARPADAVAQKACHAILRPAAYWSAHGHRGNPFLAHP